MITLTLILLFGIMLLLGKLLMFVLPVAWGGIKLVAFILFLPFTILFVLTTGLFHLLLPILFVGVLIMLMLRMIGTA